jgi:uncharacterized lipoprotein
MLRTVWSQNFRRLTEKSFVASHEDVKDVGTGKKQAHAVKITQHRRVNQTYDTDTQNELKSIAHGETFLF